MERGESSKAMSVKRKLEPRMSLVTKMRDHESKETATLSDDDSPGDTTNFASNDIDSEEGSSKKDDSDDPNQDGGTRNGDPEWMKYIKGKLNESANPMRRKSCTIFEVPANIREDSIHAYEPQVVSIGPYHRDHPNLTHPRADLTNYKRRCVDYLVARRVKSNDFDVQQAMYEKCEERMESLEKDIRSCYFDQYKLPSKYMLTDLMLFDGCFILNLLLKQVVRTNSKPKHTRKAEGKDNDNESNIKEPVLGMMWIWNMVEYDLLKLENQIPFFVLDALFELLRTPEDEDVDLVEQALELFSNLRPTKAVNFEPPRKKKFLHLLHIFHSSLSLDLGANSNALGKESHQVPPEWIPSASELHMSGVKFRSKKNASSFLDLTFKNGVMEVPRLEAYDYTETLLRNLIAFEQCYPKTEMQVTTYALFMDCIIDRAEDVNLLELKGIIVNRLSTGEAVANLFNNLCKDIHYSTDKNYLSSLFTQVTQYHDSKWHMYRARLVRDYFNNPWVIISLIAAAILLLLTVEQAFFAVFSYFKPAKK